MTEAAEPKGWTKRRWIYTVAGVLFVQVAAVALLGRSPAPVRVRPGFATRLHLIASPDAERHLNALPGFMDPALFALPSLHGYSGSAWLRYPRLEPTATERTEPPAWLKLDPSRLGARFLDYLSTNTLSPPLLVDAPLPPVLRYEAAVSGGPVAPFSRLRIEGDLARWTLKSPPELPSWAHSEVVSNTTIRAVVNASGYPFSVTLVSPSGLAAADEYAIRLVESARFKPPSGPAPRGGSDWELTWGTLVFLWHTAPWPVTNTPPEIP